MFTCMHREKEIAIPFAAQILLQDFCASLRNSTVDFVKGIYLTGSIPLRDFQPGKSDIDFIVVCSELPAGALLSEIKQLHRKTEKKFVDTHLNGWYITEDGLDRQRASVTKALYFYKGRVKSLAFEMAGITLYELKTTAVTLTGIPAEQLPVNIEINDVHAFHLRNMESYWKKWVARHASFNIHHVLLIFLPRLTEWVLLGVARQLYALRNERITSKTNAGFYCLQHLPYKYHRILEEAIEIRTGKVRHFPGLNSSYYLQPSFKRARDTIACAKYIIRLFDNEYRKLTAAANG
jgi:hypothetical protein